MSQSSGPVGNKLPDTKPAYFISAARGACVNVVDLRSTFFTLVFHNGKSVTVPAGKSGLYLARQVFFRHRDGKQLLQLHTFHEN